MLLPEPRISVVIPTLLEGKYLDRTLRQFSDKLRKQFNLEIIVSDGGSSDNTLEIAGNYTDCVLRHQGKGRQTISKGRNVGAAKASGEFLVFLNGDTVIAQPEQFFGRIITVLADRKVVAATCDVTIYPEEETFADKAFHGFFNIYFRLLNVIGIGMGRGECQIVRRNPFFEVGGYDENLVAGEDFDLFVKLRRHGKIVFLSGLKVWESPRRFRRYGYRKITLLWFLNALSVFFRGKSAAKEWEPIR